MNTFNSKLFLDSLIDEVCEKLQTCTPADVVAINSKITAAMGEKFNLTSFIVGAIQEAQQNDMDCEIEGRLSQLIARAFDQTDAFKFASQIVGFYESEIIAYQESEAWADEYARLIS